VDKELPSLPRQTIEVAETDSTRAIAPQFISAGKFHFDSATQLGPIREETSVAPEPLGNVLPESIPSPATSQLRANRDEIVARRHISGLSIVNTTDTDAVRHYLKIKNLTTEFEFRISSVVVIARVNPYEVLNGGSLKISDIREFEFDRTAHNVCFWIDEQNNVDTNRIQINDRKYTGVEAMVVFRSLLNGVRDTDQSNRNQPSQD